MCVTNMQFVGAMLVACTAHNILLVSSSGANLLQESFQPERISNPFIINESRHNGTPNDASDSSQHHQDEKNVTTPSKIIIQTHTNTQPNDQTNNKTPFTEAPQPNKHSSQGHQEIKHFEYNPGVSEPLNPSYSQNPFGNINPYNQTPLDKNTYNQSSSVHNPYNNPLNASAFDNNPYKNFTTNKNINDSSSQFQNSNSSRQLRISEINCRKYCAILGPPSPPLTMALIVAGGGVDAKKYEFPHAAAIGWKLANRTDYSWPCGGSLISERFVLTAAHCAQTRDSSFDREEPVIVRLGGLDFTVEDEDIQDIAIQEFIKHPDYKPPSKYHDIALIRLAESAIFSKSVRPTCLWSKEIPENSVLTAIGWGALRDGGDNSVKLQKVSLEEVKQEVCNESYGRRFLKIGIIPKQICARHDKMDTCRGDSGGALMIKSYNFDCINQVHLVGVTSFGSACLNGIPGVYTRVSAYLDWIEGHVWPQDA